MVKWCNMMCDIKGVENGGGMKLKQRTIFYYQDELHKQTLRTEI